MVDDADLLRRYLEAGSEAAFAELVRRHVDFVYATALRMTKGSHRAEDVTQSVFADLCRQARKLAGRRDLLGWLYISTHYAATALIRQESRREQRERAAALPSPEGMSSPPEASMNWEQLAPVLDDVLGQLNPPDRDAILLRFFRNASFAEIGAVLCLSENTARMRVARALDKAGKLLARRGITSTAAALEFALASQTAVAAPAAWAGTIPGAAILAAKAGVGAAAAGGLFAFMNTTKLVLGTAVLVSLLAIAVIVPERQARHALELQLTAVTNDRDSLRQRLGTIEAETTRLPTTVPKNDPDRVSAPAPAPALAGVTAPDPAVDQAAAADPRREKFHSRYDPFFRQRGFTPEQAERFVDLQIESENARADLQAAVRSQGLTVEAEIEALRSRLMRPINGEFRDLLGEDGLAAFGRFEKYSYYRPVFVDPLVQEFSAFQLPLSDAQIERLVVLVSDNDRPVKLAPSDLGKQSEIDWSAVTEQAGEILTPAQLELLKIKARVFQQKQQAEFAKRSKG